jgi:hypothetical protein
VALPGSDSEGSRAVRRRMPNPSCDGAKRARVGGEGARRFGGASLQRAQGRVERGRDLQASARGARLRRLLGRRGLAALAALATLSSCLVQHRPISVAARAPGGVALSLRSLKRRRLALT